MTQQTQSSSDPVEPQITLRDYFDAKFHHLTDHVDEKFTSLRDHVDTRFDAKDREAALRYPNRDEYNTLTAKVSKLENVDSEIRGKASQAQVTEMQSNVRSLARMTMGGLAFSALTIIVTVVLFFARKG